MISFPVFAGTSTRIKHYPKGILSNLGSINVNGYEFLMNTTGPNHKLSRMLSATLTCFQILHLIHLRMIKKTNGNRQLIL
jgi:hypothetical protein